MDTRTGPAMMGPMTKRRTDPLPGNPRSWENEAAYVPETLAEVRWLVDHLRVRVSHSKAWSLVGWLDMKATTGEDPTAQPTRAEYRKVLAALPTPPWPTRPLKETAQRLTPAARSRQAGVAGLRELLAGSTAAGGAAMAAGVPVSAVGVVLASLYITRNEGTPATSVDPQRFSAAGVAMVCAHDRGNCAHELARAA